MTAEFRIIPDISWGAFERQTVKFLSIDHN